VSTTDKSGSGLTQQFLDVITIHSEGASVNTITGSIIGTAADVSSTVVEVENNVKKVVLDLQQDLVIEGDIVFTDRGTVVGQTATLTLTGPANVSVQQLDVSDAQIGALTIAHNGTGTLTVTGTSPALFDNAGSDPANLETLTFTGTGNVKFGDADATTAPWGITAENLSTINAAGLSGSLDLGTIDGVDGRDFTFTSGSGVTKLSMVDDALDADNSAGIGLDQSGTWTFNLASADVGSELHLGAGLVLGNSADLAATDRSNALTITLGTNATLYIDADTDFTQLDSLTISGAQSIVLAKGVDIIMTAAQASGKNIIPAAGIVTNPLDPLYVLADVPTVTLTNLGTASYGLSGIAASIAGTATLAADDVTLAATTDLGAFSITLDDVNSTGVADELAGQTIRFTNRVNQADGREIIITGNDVTNAEQDTNVVWLFPDAEAPVGTVINTDNYSANLGRLWVRDTLVDGRNFEELVSNLDQSIIVRVENNNVLTSTLVTTGYSRVVEVEANTDLTTGMTFTDLDNAGQAYNFVENLTLTLGGEVNAGMIEVGNILAGPISNDDEFNTLTINSVQADSPTHYLLPSLQAGQVWGPGLVTIDTTPGVDSETLTIGAALDVVDNGNESITISYTLDGSLASVTVNAAAIDFTNQASVVAAVVLALDGIAGVSASAAGNVVTVSAPDNGSFELISVAVGGTTDGMTAADFTIGEGADAAQVQTITVTDTVFAGYIYTLSASMADGGDITVSYTANTVDGLTQDAVALGLVNAFNLVAGASTVNAGVVGNIITLTDEVADNGGFESTFTAAGRVALPTGANVVGDIRVDDNASVVNFDLGNVVVNTGTGLTSNDIEIGTVYFEDDGDALIGGGTVAQFQVNGNSDVTVKSLDVSDPDLTGLIVDNNLAAGATLLVTGGSPAFDGGLADPGLFKGTESLTINSGLANVTTTFGSTVGATTYAGVYGEELSLVTVTEAGTVNLGTIIVDPLNFTLAAAGMTGGSVSLTLGAADANGAKASTLAAAGVWTFNFDATNVDSMTITSAAVLNAGGTLVINNADTLNIVGAVNLSALNLTLTGTAVVIPLGSALTLNVADANSLTVDGDGSLVLVGAYSGENLGEINVRNIDMSALTDPVADVLPADTVATVVLDLSDETPVRNHTVLGSITEQNQITGNDGTDSITGGNLADTLIGAEGGDTLSGGLGNDTLSGGLGNDSLVGGDGNDTVDGGADNDTILGGIGDDLLTGGAGNDSIDAGAGNDTINGFEGADTVNGGADNDTLQLVGATTDFNAATDAQLVAVENIVGTGAGEVITTTNQTENLTINGGGGNDTITSGSGNDSITGGADVDSIVAGAGNDTIVGAQDDALLDGGADADVLQIGASFDDTSDAQIIRIETVNLTAAGLTVNLAGQGAGANNEPLTINAYANAALVTGVATNGTAGTAESSSYTLNGLIAGQSITIGGLTVTATADATAAQVGDAFRGVTVTGLALTGAFAATGWVGATLGGAGATLTFTNTANGDVADLTASSTVGSNITGGADNDTINGGNGADTLNGSTGADSILAGAGNDTIVGAQDDALLDGGAGADVLQVGANFDDVSNGQINLVETVNLTVTGLTVSLDAQTEALAINGFATGASTIIGGTGNDTITGGSGADSINGAAGADSVLAGGGNDTIVGAQDDALLDGDADADVLQIGANFNDVSDAQVSGIETVNLTAAGLTVSLDAQGALEGMAINAFLNYAPVTGVKTDGTAVTPESSAFTLGAITAGQSVTINGLTVTATAGATDVQLADAFRGVAVTGLTRTGTSGTPTGWTGAAIVGGTGASLTFTNTVNGDIADVTLVSTTVGSTIVGGEGADTITGSNGADSLTGGLGADSILAGAGNDILVGAQGDALLDGGAGADVLQLGANFDDSDPAQVNLIETVNLTATGLTVLMDDQTEGLAINGFASGASTIVGGLGADTIIGGAGADSLTGGAGVDSVDGGAGNDTVVVSTTADDGTDTLVGGANTDTLRVTGALTFSGSVSGFEAVSLAEAAVLVIASAELADNAIVTVTGTNGGVTESVTFNGTALADNINLSTITSVTDAVLVVNAGAQNDTIVGSNFGDSLNGEAGLDTITGGQGNDTMSGGAGADTFIFVADAVAETDTITDWSGDATSGQLGAGDLLNVTFAAPSTTANTIQVNPAAAPTTPAVLTFNESYDAGDQIAIVLAGESFTITVAAGRTSGFNVAQDVATVLSTYGGFNAADADLVNGATGFVVSPFGTQAGVVSITNDGTDVGTPSTFTLTANVIDASGILFDAYGNGSSGLAAVNGRLNVVATLGEDDTIVGGVGNDTIDGGDGNDSIVGNAGADSITGGAGADSLTGGLGADTFVIGSTGDGGDTIQDFSVAQGDVLDLSGIALGDTIVTNVSVAGGVGTLLAAGVNVIVYTADNAVDTAAEVDAMLLAQNGSLNQHQATYILTDNGTDTYVWVDDHLDLDNSGAGATLVATLVGVADASTIVIGTNFQG